MNIAPLSKARRECRGVGGPCPRRTTSSLGYCAICWRRVLEIRAIEETRELAGLPCPRPEPERSDDDEQPERDEDPDGTRWTPVDE